MESLIILNKISAIAVWVIFWGYVIGIWTTKKNEFRSVFSGVKKMPSAAVIMFIFFTLLNFMLTDNKYSAMNALIAPWVFVSSQLIGYALLLSGFWLIMRVAWSFQEPVPAGSKFELFKYLQKRMYLGTIMIAFGSSTIFLNTAAVKMSILLIPLILYRIWMEKKANASI